MWYVGLVLLIFGVNHANAGELIVLFLLFKNVTSLINDRMRSGWNTAVFFGSLIMSESS